MKRRQFVVGAALAPSLLSAPSLRAQSAKVLKFIPQADLAVVDPHFSIAFVTRNHAFLVYDTLYGVDEAGHAQPQMAAGHTVEYDGRTWNITLREGLRFHDGTPVLARDVVASLKRWATRDPYPRSVFESVDELIASSDKVVKFRLKKPFRLLAEMLAKPSPYMPAIMPERLALTSSAQPLTEIIGSGPYRYLASERLVGSRNVYQRFEEYVPRNTGQPMGTSGPKVAHFDRVEWRTIPDAGTAAAALQAGEVDWWEQPIADLLPLLKSSKGVKVDVLDTAGQMAVMRFNHLVAPFDKPAVRRAFLGAFSQTDMMTAVAGSDPALSFTDVGYFQPSSDMASKAGLDQLKPRDLKLVKANLEAAGYNGERVRLIAPVDLPAINAMSEVAADVFRKLGVNLDYVSIDWGSALTRLSSKNPVDQGGWSATCNYTTGFNTINPAAHGFLRSTGESSIFGWPSSPKIEELRAAWFDAQDVAQQKHIIDEIQLQALQDIPYIPLGGFYLASAYRSNLTGFIKGTVPLFYNVRRE